MSAMGRAGEGGEQPLRLRPGPERPAGPAWGGVSSGRAGRAVPRRHRGTGPAVRPPSARAMASAARGSGPWPPLLLQLAALLGTLRPQVRSGRPRSLQARVGGAGVQGCGGATGGASPSPGSGWPQVSPCRRKPPRLGELPVAPRAAEETQHPVPPAAWGCGSRKQPEGGGPRFPDGPLKTSGTRLPWNFKGPLWRRAPTNPFLQTSLGESQRSPLPVTGPRIYNFWEK